jgi:hypothetical protein
MRKKQSFIGLLIIVLLALSIGTWYLCRHSRQSNKRTEVAVTAPAAQTATGASQEAKQQGYALNIKSGRQYEAFRASKISFTVEKDGQIVKDFIATDGSVLHAYLIKKDRESLQHVHPILTSTTGTFSGDILFPTNGEYRLYAEFVPAGGDATAQVLTADINAGSVTGYELKSRFNGRSTIDVEGSYIASFFFPPNDDSAGPPNTNFYVNGESIMMISLSRNNDLYKVADKFEGSSGKLTIIGPDLQLVRINAETVREDDASGLLVFKHTYRKAGLYRLFLEIKTEQPRTQFEFALDIKDIKKD